MPSTTLTEPAGRVEPVQALRLDEFADRAQAAAREFRGLDQEAVDRIVWAMVGEFVDPLQRAYEGRSANGDGP
jgi:hypothetical protein